LSERLSSIPYCPKLLSMGEEIGRYDSKDTKIAGKNKGIITT
jgi:hypothetical protein